MIENVELTDILDPYLFDNHRDIINALFEVYYDIGDQYLDKFHQKEKSTVLKE